MREMRGEMEEGGVNEGERRGKCEVWGMESEMG